MITKICSSGGAGFIINILISNLIVENKIIAYDNSHRDTLTNSKYINQKNLTIIKGDVLNYNNVLKKA